MTFRYLLLPLFFCTLLACQPENNSQSNAVDNPEGFLQHTVYFYLNNDVTPQEIEQFESGLEDLVGIDAIYKAEVGVPGSTEVRDVTDHSFAYSIFTWFETLDDYNVYADHPDHLEFIDAYNHLWADVKVYDSELIYSR